MLTLKERKKNLLEPVSLFIEKGRLNHYKRDESENVADLMK